MGTVSPPVWKETHALISVLNSSVKYLGTGVSVNVGGGVNVIAAVAVSVGGWIVAVGIGSDVGVDETLWQAVIRIRHPRRSFFIALLITQLPELYAGCTKAGQLNLNATLYDAINRSLEHP